MIFVPLFLCRLSRRTRVSDGTQRFGWGWEIDVLGVVEALVAAERPLIGITTWNPQQDKLVNLDNQEMEALSLDDNMDSWSHGGSHGGRWSRRAPSAPPRHQPSAVLAVPMPGTWEKGGHVFATILCVSSNAVSLTGLDVVFLQNRRSTRERTI